jgi:hypothetical protein
MIISNTARLLFGIFWGLIASWIIATAFYWKKMREAKIEMWEAQDKVWNSLFDWTNKELRELPDSNEFSPQARIIFQDVLIKFQAKIQDEKMKLSKGKAR